MTSSMKFPLAALVAVGAILAHASIASASVYSGGHGDLGVAFEDDEFHVHAHLGAGAIVDGLPLVDDEEFHGDDLTILVPETANIGRNHVILGGSFEEYDFTAASFNFLGTGAGQDFWLLPFDSADASHYDAPFVGWAAHEGFVPSEWTGSIVLSLTGFSGPGAFSVFTGGGTRRMDTQDNSYANDSLNVGVGGHSHFHMGFTAPGLYEVEITATGTHNTLGVITGTETFQFMVVPEPSSFVLLGIAVPAMALALRRRRNRRQ